MLQHLIEAKRVSQTEVNRATGIADSTISEVLKEKRSLNRNHIGKRPPKLIDSENNNSLQPALHRVFCSTLL